MTRPEPKRSAWRRAGPWVFAVLVLGAVIAVAGHFGESKEFARILREARPIWLLAMTALQLGTYVAAAAVFKVIYRGTGEQRSVGDLVALVLAKLFVDQVVPSGGISGTVVMVKGLERRGVPAPVVAA